MKMKKSGPVAVTPANTKIYARIVVLSGAGIVLALTEFLCLPALMPKPATFPRAIHGELISPLSETDSAIIARMPVLQQWSSTLAPAISPPRPTFTTLETADGYRKVGFDTLAGFQVFVYHQITDPVRFTSVPKLSRPIPYSVKSLNNRKVAVQGFMLPLKFENDRATEFLLLKSRSFCCYGAPPRINEWIRVRMNAGGVKSIIDQPVTVYGTLHVAEIFNNGQLACLYKLDGEKLDEPMNFR